MAGGGEQVFEFYNYLFILSKLLEWNLDSGQGQRGGHYL
jgi:hypothetical protein